MGNSVPEPQDPARHRRFGDEYYNILFSAFIEGLYKNYPFDWLIYVCHETVIEDLFRSITQ